VTVVDNGSRESVAPAVRRHPLAATVIELGENRGAAARNDGAMAAGTEYVAFSDDDSWWEPGALAKAEQVLDGHPRLALIAARVLVGRERRLDPTSAEMAASPLDRDGDLPGPSVLGFLACGAVVRRSAFLAAGGFERRLGVGGEEELLAIDLAALGHRLAYVADVVAIHEPAHGGRPRRDRDTLRNSLLVAWLRRPAGDALRRSLRLLGRQRDCRQAVLATFDALRAARWASSRRRAVPPPLARELRALDRPSPVRRGTAARAWRRARSPSPGAARARTPRPAGRGPGAAR
jgi:GT2 family glycosyltransferase